MGYSNMQQHQKKFFIYLGISFVILTVFNDIAKPEIASAGINIRDENGDVTTWGWWLVNIFAPWFVAYELVKIIVGIVLLIFGVKSGSDFLVGAWANLTVMWPGLFVWYILSYISGNSNSTDGK
jgi:hypothetical protein